MSSRRWPVWIILGSCAAAHGAAPAFSPQDVFAQEWAERPVFSPDGRQIVYQRTFFDVMKDVRRSNLWLVSVDSKVETALVRIPGASHGINQRPSQMIAQVLNSAAWFARYQITTNAKPALVDQAP